MPSAPTPTVPSRSFTAADAAAREPDVLWPVRTAGAWRPHDERRSEQARPRGRVLGLGKSVVSTPYWHASELLAGDSGMLVPFRDSEALTAAVLSLLSDDERRDAIACQALARGQRMTWPRVGEDYLAVIEEAVRERGEPAAA